MIYDEMSFNKIRLFICIIFLISCILSSTNQNKVVQIDDLELKENLYYHENQTKPFSGVAVRKNRKGNLEEKMPIVNGLIHGHWVQWDDDGKISGEGDFDSGTGKFIEYYASNKNDILAEIPYFRNLEHGKTKFFFENGNLSTLHPYKNGKLDGTQKQWTESGEIILEREWKNDFLNGKWREWYIDGSKEAEGFFIMGKGELTKWYKNGQKKSFTRYLKNLRHGKTLGWYENGIKKYEYEYSNGKVHGKRVRWKENGEIELIEIYKNGEYVKTIKNDKDDK